MMEVQKYLQDQLNQGANEDCALDILHEDLGIKVKRYKDRVVLNYNQIDSPKTHPIVVECRGLILSYPSFEVMARGFDRFYNYGEAPELSGKVDFKTSICYEKADGSYISVYHDGTEWCIATRGTAFAECENYSGRIFKDMVLEAFGRDKTIDESFKAVRQEIVWIFEFTSPENRVVTRYKKAEMVLTGVRNKITGEFSKVDLWNLASFLPVDARGPKYFDISTAEAALQAAKELKDLEEGFVIFDTVSGARVKIKSPTYVAVHHIKGEGLTPKRISHLVTCGEVDEYLGYFPEDIQQIIPYTFNNQEMLRMADVTFTKCKSIESQKDFALKVKDMVQSPILFMARRNKTSPSQEFNLQKNTMKVKMLLKFMNL